MTSTHAPLTSADEAADQYDVNQHSRRARTKRPPHLKEHDTGNWAKVTAVMSGIERIHRVTAPTARPRTPGAAGRPSHYPHWVYGLILAGVASSKTQRAAVADVAALWPLIRQAAAATPATTDDLLPEAGPERWHYRYWYERMIDDDVADAMLDAFTRDAIDLAQQQGMLTATAPFGANAGSRPNAVTGDVKFYDPPSDHTGDEVDEVTGELVRRHRVDPSSRQGRRGGQTESCWGSPFQTLSVRQDGWRGRVVLDFAYVQKGLGEAQMFVNRVLGLIARGAAVHATLYDAALRGTHVSQLAEAGLLAVSPVIAERSDGGGSKARRGRTEKSRLLAVHDGPSGTCRHLIHGVGGRAHEAVINDRGQTDMTPLDHRNERRARGNGRWVWYAVVRVQCPHGEKTTNGSTHHEVRLPLTQQPEDTAKGFQRCEYLRQLPPSTAAYDEFYSNRNDAETLHSQTKNCWAGGRIPAYGRRRQLLLLIGFGLAENCLTAWIAAGKPPMLIPQL